MKKFLLKNVIILTLINILLSGLSISVKSEEVKQYKVYPAILVHGCGEYFEGWEWNLDPDPIRYITLPNPKTFSFISSLYNCYSDREEHYNSTSSKVDPLHLNMPAFTSEFGVQYPSLQSNIFGITYSKRGGPIEDNAEELNWAINGKDLSGGTHQDGIRDIMYKAYPKIFLSKDDVKVVIIAHSMGGLSARKYIQDHPDNHHVAKLITIATPHLGSDLASYPIKGAELIAAGTSMMLLAWLFPPLLPAGYLCVQTGGVWTSLAVMGISIFSGCSVPGVAQMQPYSRFIQQLNGYDCGGTIGSSENIYLPIESVYDHLKPIPTNLEYRLIGGLLDEGTLNLWRIVNFFTFGLVVPSTLSNGDGYVNIGSALATGGNFIETPFTIGNPTLKNYPHFLIQPTDHYPRIYYEYNTILRALEDPPVISNVSYVTSGNQPLQNNSLLDISKPNIKITGNLWDYLLHKLDAKLNFSHQIVQQIDFDTFGAFCETTTLAAGGKNTIFVSASNPANYYSSSSPYNIYLVGISYPRDGMILTPESSSEFQYSFSTRDYITTSPQYLTFSGYQKERGFISLPPNSYRLSLPQNLDGTLNSEVVFVRVNGGETDYFPADGEGFIVENESYFKAIRTSGETSPITVQYTVIYKEDSSKRYDSSLSFGDYGGALPEKIIDLPANACRLSLPKCLNGDTNPDIIFLDENDVQLQPDESGNYNVEGKTKFKAKLKNDYKGKTFVKLQGNADANQWSAGKI